MFQNALARCDGDGRAAARLLLKDLDGPEWKELADIVSRRHHAVFMHRIAAEARRAARALPPLAAAGDLDGLLDHLQLGAVAGGLSMTCDVHGAPMTPVEAAAANDHSECAAILRAAATAGYSSGGSPLAAAAVDACSRDDAQTLAILERLPGFAALLEAGGIARLPSQGIREVSAKLPMSLLHVACGMGALRCCDMLLDRNPGTLELHNPVSADDELRHAGLGATIRQCIIRLRSLRPTSTYAYATAMPGCVIAVGI